MLGPAWLLSPAVLRISCLSVPPAGCVGVPLSVVPKALRTSADSSPVWMRPCSTRQVEATTERLGLLLHLQLMDRGDAHQEHMQMI